MAGSGFLEIVEADVLIALGNVLLARDRADQARPRHVEALNLARWLGASREQADALRGLASAHCALGDAGQSEICRRSAFELYVGLGAPEADEVRAEEEEAGEAAAVHDEQWSIYQCLSSYGRLSA